jgi:hypothetical protein
MAASCAMTILKTVIEAVGDDHRALTCIVHQS